MTRVSVKPLARSGAELRRFLQVSHEIYRGDPHWVAPLRSDAEKLLSNRNPFFEHAEMQLWIAGRDGRDLGRIAGIVDRRFNEFHRNATASFGFFECVNEPAVSAALFAAALDWARSRGLKRIIGPLNPSTNEECGLLTLGFESPPVFMMSYNPPYYVGFLEAAGFTKAKDLLAFAFDLANAPNGRFERFAERFKEREPGITINPVTRRTLSAVLADVKEVYNAAWEANWGFVPMTDGEIEFLAARLKPLLTAGLAYLARNVHEPVGFLLALPDFNEPFKALKGRWLSPALPGFLPYLFGWRMPRACRVVALGVKAKYRGRGIESAMLAQGLRAGFALGFRSVEASWILEDNLPARRVIELFGGEPYKAYRIYERLV